jgi:hypothetical protein
LVLSDLRSLVLTWLDDVNAGYFTTSNVNVWLNNAQRETQKRLVRAGQNYYTKTVQTTLVVNQRDYVLPGDIKKIHRVDVVISGSSPNESVQALTPITWNQQDMIAFGSSTPRCYAIKRNRISLFPAPDSAITLRLTYTYLVTDMTIDTDSPDVPSDYHELIALLAAQDGFLKDGRASELLVKKIAEYEKDMDSDANERRQDMSREIRDTGESNTSGFYF